MVSRADRSRFAEWWRTVDKAMLTALLILMVGGVVLSLGASPDSAIAPLLARYASREGIAVLRNESNRGFTATANRGITEAGRADVVLLNADTEVGPNWLTGLSRAAVSGAEVATVTAVSDNAGAFSVPELERENAWPSCWTFEQAARALWHGASTAYPELPTGNGFCMYIRRAVIDEVGALDEAALRAATARRTISASARRRAAIAI